MAANNYFCAGHLNQNLYMAHETHHETSHSTEIKSKTAMSASFWFVLILAGLFIAAVNFVNVESNTKEEGEGVKTEAIHGETGETPAAAAPATEEHAAAPAEGAATTDSAAHQTADTAHAASH